MGLANSKWSTRQRQSKLRSEGSPTTFSTPIYTLILPQFFGFVNTADETLFDSHIIIAGRAYLVQSDIRPKLLASVTRCRHRKVSYFKGSARGVATPHSLALFNIPQLLEFVKP